MPTSTAIFHSVCSFPIEETPFLALSHQRIPQGSGRSDQLRNLEPLLHVSGTTYWAEHVSTSPQTFPDTN